MKLLRLWFWPLCIVMLIIMTVKDCSDCEGRGGVYSVDIAKCFNKDALK